MSTFTKTTKPGSLVVIDGTFTKDEVATCIPKARQQLKKRVTLDGFRDGAIPDAMLDAKIGLPLITDTAAEILLREKLPALLIEHGVMPLVAPQVSIHTHEDGAAHVTIEATVYPLVTIPDYKQIAADINKNKKEVTITDEEAANALIHFRRERVRVEALERGESPESALKSAEETVVEALPPLDDEFVKQIGFDSIAAFEENMRKNLHTSKSDQVRSEHRAEILKAITMETKADVPEPLVAYEIAKMESGLSEYLSQVGLTLDGYLQQIKKTREDIHTEWHDEAHKRAQTQLALIEIGKRENIEEDKKELDALVQSVLQRMPDADTVAVETHYATVLRNEKVLSFLESQA
ncbi:MAG: hypothetical protein RI911_482 [Candidatus Parcubacteria bacterium]|jgi:FKBP-type peptidyl-prolyl cis-trans isomerase (trigger factor)